MIEKLYCNIQGKCIENYICERAVIDFNGKYDSMKNYPNTIEHLQHWQGPHSCIMVLFLLFCNLPFCVNKFYHQEVVTSNFFGLCGLWLCSGNCVKQANCLGF